MSTKTNLYSPVYGRENHNRDASIPQRPSFMNQQIGVAVRPQLPSDASGMMTRWQPGELPRGGSSTVFDFSGNAEYDTKKSPTRGGGRGVY